MDWESYFRHQADLHNSAPVEAVIKTVAYHLRALRGADWSGLHFLEVGCGAGNNLAWLAGRGVRVSGIDVSPTAVAIAQSRLREVCAPIGRIETGTATRLPFPDAALDGVIEACVIQHLPREDRSTAYREIARVLRPGGLFVGYSLSAAHPVYRAHLSDQVEDDPGTVVLCDPRLPGRLPGIGRTHFFEAAEFSALAALLPFRIECLPVTFALPRDEAARRGYAAAEYVDRFLVVYGVKVEV